jgi:hypothetical protein
MAPTDTSDQGLESLIVAALTGAAGERSGPDGGVGEG